MTRTRTPMGDYVTTNVEVAPDGSISESVTIECTQPLRIISLESKGTNIYDRPVDPWMGLFDVKKSRSNRKLAL